MSLIDQNCITSMCLVPLSVVIHTEGGEVEVLQLRCQTSSQIFFSVPSITGNRIYKLGETSEIICSTEDPMQSIQWLDGSSRVVREGTSVQELVLNLTIADSHNNSRYTCRVSQGTFIGEEMITINTKCKRIVRLTT